MRTFIYIFGFLSLALSPVTCALEQQTNNGVVVENTTALEASATSQGSSTEILSSEIDPPIGTPKP